VLGHELGRLAVLGHAHLSGAGQFAVAEMDRDLVLLHQAGDALV
jgi:hypothetical protein